MELPVRFEAKALIGQGGMGKVYHVLDKETNQSCALKVSTAGQDTQSAAQFAKEAWVWFQFRSVPYVVEVLEVIQLNNERIGILMELMDGGNLRRLIGSDASHTDRVAAVCDVAKGLEGCLAIHPGFAHLDIKPENCIRTKYKMTKISDFGLASRNSFGTLFKPKFAQRQINSQSLYFKTQLGNRCVGTPLYMSPEQILGDDRVSPASDVYSLCVMALELFTDHNPFESAQSYDELFNKHLKGLSVIERQWPTWLDRSARTVLDAGLSPNPKSRPSLHEIWGVLAEKFDGPHGALLSSDRIERIDDTVRKAKSLRALGVKDQARALLKEALTNNPVVHPQFWRQLGGWQNEDVTIPAVSPKSSKPEIDVLFTDTCDFLAFAYYLSSMSEIEEPDNVEIGLAMAMQLYYAHLHGEASGESLGTILISEDGQDARYESDASYRKWYSDRLNRAVNRFDQLQQKQDPSHNLSQGELEFLYLCTRCGSIRHVMLGRCPCCGFLPIKAKDLFETYWLSYGNIKVTANSEKGNYWSRRQYLESLGRNIQSTLTSLRSGQNYEEELTNFTTTHGASFERMQRDGSTAELFALGYPGDAVNDTSHVWRRLWNRFGKWLKFSNTAQI